MNWDDLKIFLDVVRQPKLERTAAKLNLDATTISRRLKRLEFELGATLFERTRRGHMLTPAGELLAKQVEAMESLASDIAAESDGGSSASGRIRLGAPEGIGVGLLAPAIAGFKRQNPSINIDLIALSGFVSVPRREADMSILLTRPTAGKIKIRRLSHYSLGLYGTDQYLDRFDTVTSIDQLNTHTLVGYVDDLIYSSQLRYLEDLLPGRTPDLCSTSINAQLRMIVSGAGLGILPQFMADQYPSLRRVLENQVNLYRTFWLAVHEDVASLQRNRILSEFLARTLSDLP